MMDTVHVPIQTDMAVTVKTGSVSIMSPLTFAVEPGLPCAVALGFNWFMGLVRVSECGVFFGLFLCVICLSIKL